MVPNPNPDATPSQNDKPTLRRFLDILISFVLLTFLLPVFAVVYVLIKRDSAGPAIYRQKRVGLNGRNFEIKKFRTMSVGADTSGPSVTSADDRRVTKIGRLLRDNKLDELPQLLNVLRGDMSLVGPRPQVPRFVEMFDESLRPIVLSVRPGITGPTTLHYRHEEELLADKPDRECYYITTILPTKLQMDVEYVQDRSLDADLRVLEKTVLMFTIGLGRRIARSLYSSRERSWVPNRYLKRAVLQQADEPGGLKL